MAQVKVWQAHRTSAERSAKLQPNFYARTKCLLVASALIVSAVNVSRERKTLQTKSRKSDDEFLPKFGRIVVAEPNYLAKSFGQQPNSAFAELRSISTGNSVSHPTYCKNIASD